MTVRPLVPLAQIEGEDAAVLLLNVFQDVRHQHEILVEADEARVAPHVDEPDVLGAADHRAQVTAVGALGSPQRGKVHYQRLGRDALGDRRQTLVRVREGRDLLHLGNTVLRERGGGPRDRDQGGKGCADHQAASSLFIASPGAQTKCPGETSTIVGTAPGSSL